MIGKIAIILLISGLSYQAAAKKPWTVSGRLNPLGLVLKPITVGRSLLPAGTQVSSRVDSARGKVVGLEATLPDRTVIKLEKKEFGKALGKAIKHFKRTHTAKRKWQFSLFAIHTTPKRSMAPIPNPPNQLRIEGLTNIARLMGLPGPKNSEAQRLLQGKRGKMSSDTLTGNPEVDLIRNGVCQVNRMVKRGKEHIEVQTVVPGQFFKRVNRVWTRGDWKGRTETHLRFGPGKRRGTLAKLVTHMLGGARPGVEIDLRLTRDARGQMTFHLRDLSAPFTDKARRSGGDYTVIQDASGTTFVGSGDSMLQKDM